MNNLYSVITTIQQPTKAVEKLTHRLQANYAPLLIIGDKKGPNFYDLEGTIFVSFEKQLDMRLAIAEKLPVGHYTRKNIGYLEAIRQGATCIYETDDDNAPLPNWSVRAETISAQIVEETGWINAYRHFSKEKIWPRGLPLDELTRSFEQGVKVSSHTATVQAPIQQGLANGSPDVDAIWRLVLDTPFSFEDRTSICLPQGAWCPFNSQSTWWWPSAYPLLYLPSYCTFRMTDIWRSFIAQRCLWAMDMTLAFHAAEVEQDRNLHNLMHDFEDEVPGYVGNRKIAEILQATELSAGIESVGSNLRRCYEVLIKAGFLPMKELELVDAWLHDLRKVSS